MKKPSGRISVDDLTPETKRKLGITTKPERNFTKESVRSHAIRVLTAIADLTQDQRRRVLEHAIKVNKA